MRREFFIGVVLALFLNGCSIKEMEKRPIDYRLSPQTKEYVVKRESDMTLKIKSLSGGDLADTRAIFYIKEGLLLPYKYARWSEPPAKRLQQIFTETLSRQNIFKGVVDSHSYALSDTLLEGRILHFEQVYREDGSSYIHVQLRVNLVKRKEATLLASKLFDNKVEISKQETQESVKAFNIAVEKILKHISEWVYEKTKY